MRVRVIQACRVAYNSQVLDLASGAEIRGPFATYLAGSGAPVEILQRDPEETQPPQQSTGSEATVTPPVTTGDPATVVTGDPEGEGGEAPPGIDPNYSIGDILAWVGSDPQRARQALEAEKSKADKARTSLVARLTTLIGE
jgi:hypothetical protein